MAGGEDEAKEIIADIVVERGFEVGDRELLLGFELAGKLLVLPFKPLPPPQPVDGAQFLAVAISQAPGLSGMPVSGHRSSATTRASCASSSASPTSRSIRARPAISFACSILKTASMVRWVSVAATPTD